jgi:hypothetical protein
MFGTLSMLASSLSNSWFMLPRLVMTKVASSPGCTVTWAGS